MNNFIMGVIVTLAVMNPTAAKQFLSKTVDGLHSAFVTVNSMVK